MRIPSRRRLAPFLLLAALTSACTDAARTPSAPAASEPPVQANVVPSVEAQIDAIFPRGLRNAAQARWATVKRHYGDGSSMQSVERARGQMFLLVDWVLRQEPKLGSSALASLVNTASVSPAVAQLIASMYAYVFPNAPLPPTALTGDAVIGVVLPTAPATIVTPAKLAGVAFPAGAVSEPMLLVIHEKPGAAALYAAACSGPLPTTLCQYPLFYEFHPFPAQTLLTPARAGVCFPTSGPRAPSASVKPRTRLAHEAPAPSAVLGYVYEGIEVLPHAHVDDFLECDDVAFTPPVLSQVENPFVRGGLRLLAMAGGSALRAVAPRKLYAYDRGGGGELLAFSNFNHVDTLVVAPLMPDLAITSAYSWYRGLSGGSPDTMLVEYDTVNVSPFTIGNTGTAASGGFPYGLYLSTDSTLTSADVSLGGASSSGIAAGGSAAAPSQLAPLPFTLTHGVRWIGTLLDPPNTISEASETNNFTSRRTVLVYPNITFDTYPGGATACTPDCPLSTQFAGRAVTFAFVPSGTSPPGSTRIEHTGHGYPSNREATLTQSFIAPLSGDFVMSFAAGVRSVRFQVRGPDPIFAPTVTGTDNASATITPTVSMVTNGIDRTYTYTFTAAAGMAQVRIDMSGGASPPSHVDNIVIRP